MLGFGADYSSVPESQAGLPIAGCVGCVGGGHTPRSSLPAGSVTPSSLWEVGPGKEMGDSLLHLSPGLCLLLFPTQTPPSARPRSSGPPERSVGAASYLCGKLAR